MEMKKFKSQKQLN